MANYFFKVPGSGSHTGAISGSAHNLIAGGYSNTICDTVFCSAILGGSGNVIPAGCNYVGIFGCNITGVISCAFHANNFVAQNMPNESAGLLPSGTLYYCSTTNVVYRTP